MTEAMTNPPRRWVPLVAWSIVGVLAVIGVPALIAQAPALSRMAASSPGLHGLDMSLFAAQPLLLRIHIFTVAAAIPLGAVMMASRKGQRFHRTAGWVWVSLVAVGSITPVWLALIDHHWYPIHLASGLVMILLVTGMLAARRHDVVRHRRRMMWLFYGSLLGAGAFTFLPGRLMWRLFFG